jgi:mRNA-degrading endonuclease toxin of MazEF toxin-antitoxin module
VIKKPEAGSRKSIAPLPGEPVPLRRGVRAGFLMMELTNQFLNTVIIVPMTSTIKPYPTRLNCHFKGKDGQLVVDQIRCVDKTRLIEILGTMDVSTCKDISTLIIETLKYQ